MIKVTKDFADIPPHLTQAGTLRETQAAIAAQDGSLYKSHYKHKSVKEKLSVIYNHKCAYCESTITHSAPLQVEHYRPKAAVEQQDLATGEVHKGYYWLGNEWSNLLLACQSCNGQGAKGNRFPIKGKRIFNHPTNPAQFGISNPAMLAERALLLNPELLDDPLKHLSLNRKGIIRGKSDLGKTSVSIYQLNRPGLITRRLRVIQDFENRINEQLLERFDPALPEPLSPEQFQRQMNNIFKRIFSGQKPEVEYSFVFISIAIGFDSLILPLINKAFRPAVKESFQTFIQSIVP